jgi:GT2 family glycosyltransferase
MTDLGPLLERAETGFPPTRPSIAVIIPTTGRSITVRKAVDRLALQTRRADRIVVVGASPSDIAGMAGAVGIEVHLAPKGSCSQRNYAIELIKGDADLLAFLDDDFLPSDDYMAKVERLFLSHPDIVGVCGRPIADGADGPGIPFDDAVALLAAHRCEEDHSRLAALKGLYGCNMVIRSAAVQDVRFDERLPLYGWQEDFDFTHRIGARGRLVGWRDLSGVHMGEKSGRGSGKRFGYSQVANPLYLLGQSRMPRERALRLLRNNVGSNLLRSLWSEPYVDRRGRLFGNLLALRDLALGRLDPGRILEFD